MINKQNRPHWLLPFILALPFAGGAVYLMLRFGRTLSDALEIAAKLVVIP